uniref:Serine carboxypeptidase-like 19 n=1 Tax=Leersia perrieri TaxID=77586 RepID=A0A0D9XRN4_9ORYZ
MEYRAKSSSYEACCAEGLDLSKGLDKSWFLSFFFLLLFAATAAGSLTRTNVASLPGFDGALPSRLETGYVTVDEDNGAELFYYFIESEGDPSTDPVLLWLIGGDRCSVLSGLLLEIGPYKLVIEPYDGELPRLRYHPYSWTKLASIIFVDSPVGVAFSYSRDPKGYDVGDVSASMQLIKLLKVHPEYLSNPFYVGGDSYAGKIVPFIVQKISEDIESVVRPTLNLKVIPVQGKALTMTQQCRFPMDSESFQINYMSFASPMPKLGTIDRKILKEDGGVLQHPPPQPSIKCTGYAGYLSYFWANSNVTRRTIGIKKDTVNEWLRCHEHDLPYTSDIRSSIKYHRNVTLKGYRALVYRLEMLRHKREGVYDIAFIDPYVVHSTNVVDQPKEMERNILRGYHDAVVPFLGTQALVRSLKYPIIDDWRAWHIDGQSAGFTIAYGNNLTFATVKGGGHTAPEFEPERCFAMFKRWISNMAL